MLGQLPANTADKAPSRPSPHTLPTSRQPRPVFAELSQTLSEEGPLGAEPELRHNSEGLQRHVYSRLSGTFTHQEKGKPSGRGSQGARPPHPLGCCLSKRREPSTRLSGREASFLLRKRASTRTSQTRPGHSGARRPGERTLQHNVRQCGRKKGGLSPRGPYGVHSGATLHLLASNFLNLRTNNTQVRVNVLT